MSFESFEEIIAFAIEKEKEAAAFYTDAAKQTSFAGVKESLEEMAQEEKKHQSMLENLESNKEVLKDILSQFTLADKTCSMLQADKVVIFHSKFHKVPTQTEKSSTVPYYYELAEGEFKIDTKDTKLQEKFEAIKSTIKKNL